MARLVQSAADLGTTRRELMAGMGRTFRELPAGDFPALTALADELGRDDFDGLFEFGLDVWIAGLERQLRRTRG